MTDPYDELRHWLDMSKQNEPNEDNEMRAFKDALQREFEEKS